MRLQLFDFSLPESSVAQHPLPERDSSRLMVVRREADAVEHLTFRDLPEILSASDFLVLNSSRVIPARLWAHRPGRKERIEILLLREEAADTWSALVRPADKAPAGSELQVGDLSVRIRGIRDGRRFIAFPGGMRARDWIEKNGEPPLPPYIRRRAGEDLQQDRERYQTVFADVPGSVAAPTAGLHFTDQVLGRLTARGVAVCRILLHVGYGTFKPVRCQEIEDHEIDPEYYEVSEQAARAIHAYLAEGRRLIAVGTTAARTLEHMARPGRFPAEGSSGYTGLFIRPGFEFAVIGGLLTNFHLPKSTLFMLVCSLAGRERMLECYRVAIQEGYRFYSYGDSMLIL